MRKLALIATFCLACVANAAWALGLGSIEVYSGLNQPLRAEIPLFAVKPGDLGSIAVDLAPAAAFERTGIEQSPILSDLRFRVVEGASPDRAILQVTTVQSVREPFLALLLEISWPEGRLVREFTVLLDPPAVATGQSARRPSSSFEETGPSVSFEGDEQPRSAGAGGGSYGPVRAQETLWSIAYAQRPDASISMDQMMQAIYEANPEAFEGSISRIRAGSMLRIPSAAEIRATDPTQARREVRRERRASGTGPAPVEMDEGAPAAPAPPPAPQAAPADKPQGELRLSPPADSAAAASESAPAAGTQPAPEAEGTAAAPVVPAAAPTSTAPIEIRDNSTKALELLATHAREHSARQAASDQLTAETTEATTATPAPPAAAAPPAPPTAPAETKPPTTTPAPEAAAPTQPAAGTGTPPADSPFVEEPTPSQPPAGTAEQAPPAAEPSPPAADKKPPKAPVDVVDTSLPDATDSAGEINPLMLGLGAAAVLLLVLGAARLRKYRSAKPTVQIAPIVLSQAGEMPEPPFGAALEPPARTTPRMADTLRTAAEPQVARTVESTLQSTLPPAQTTQQFMAVSTPTPPPAMPVTIDQAPAASDPYADALGEVDIHIAYGLYDEAARLLQEPLAKSPNRKDLHLKLLEVYFSANMANEFETQAKKMQSVLTSSSDPDWEKVCIMGRQLCPGSALFGAGAGGGLGTTADLDISSMMAGAQPAAEPARPAASGTAAVPSLDLDLSGFNLGMEAPSTAAAKSPAPPAKPVAKPEPAADTGNTLDFNLDDFKFDTPAAAPADSAKSSPADADNMLDIDLTDFDIGTPTASAAAAPAGKNADTDSIDDLLSSEPEGGEGQADTRLDLARAYMDMGEPAMAQSLLQEVIAQGNAAQKQEAQELLGRLGTT